MNICRSFKHDEIVFEGQNCPICELLITHDELLDKLQDNFAAKLDEVLDERDYYHSLLEKHNPELLI